MYDDVAQKDHSVKNAPFYDKKNIPEKFMTEVFGCGNPLKYQLKDDSCLNILDIGCGTGIDIYLSKELYKNGTFIGVDISLEMLRRAQNNFQDEDIETFFVQADINKLPFKEKVFDRIVSNACIHLVPEKTDVFNGIFNTLKEKGQIFISDIVVENAWKDPFFKEEFEATGGVFLYGGIQDEKSYFKTLKKAGLKSEILKKNYFDPAPQVIPLIKSKYQRKGEEFVDKVANELSQNLFSAVEYVAYKGQKPKIANICKKCDNSIHVPFKYEIDIRSEDIKRLIDKEINMIDCPYCGELYEPEESFMVACPPSEIIVKFPKDWKLFSELMEPEVSQAKENGVDIIYFYEPDKFINEVENRYKKLKPLKRGIFQRLKDVFFS